MSSKTINLDELEYLIFSYSLKDRVLWLKIVDDLKSRYLEKEDNKKIFSFLKKYFKKYQDLPNEKIVTAELKEKLSSPEIISKIYSDPPKAERQYVYDKTFSFIKRSKVREAILKSVDFLEQDDFDSIQNLIKKAIEYNLDTERGLNIKDVDMRYAKIQKLEEEKIPTGYSQMDAILNGGWAKKSLYAVAAPPGLGKSLFLANWSVNALKNGYNVLVYTLEISEERLSMRHDAIFSKIPTKELVDNIPKLKKKYKLLEKISKGDLWIKEFPTKSANINHLKAHTEQLRIYENFIPDIIFIDYAGIMAPSYRSKNGGMYEELKTIFEDIRGWAVEMQVPIVTAAQTNRKSLSEKGGTKEIITQGQVSESLGITQTLDVFLTITQSRKEKEDGMINLYFDKHRDGESSKFIKFSIDYSNFLLEEIVI